MAKALAGLELREKLKVCSKVYQGLGWHGLDCERFQFYSEVCGRPTLPLVHKITKDIYSFIEKQDGQGLLAILQETKVSKQEKE